MDKIQRRKQKIYSMTSPLPTKKTISKIFKFILLGFIIFSNYWIVNTLFINVIETEAVKCGVIAKIFERNEYNSKSGKLDRVSKIIVMKYDNNNFVEKNVDDRTYYKGVKGGRMCFTEPIDDVVDIRPLAVILGLIFCVFYIIIIIEYWNEICKPFKWMWNKLPE